jgi:hypothetical protein
MAIHERKIDEVFVFKTGKFIKSEDILNCYDSAVIQEDELGKLRKNLENAIQGNIKPIYGCPYCRGLLKLRANGSQKIITHFYAIHDADCPLKNDQNLTKEQILKIKFNGQQESRKHKYMKEELAKLLQDTPYMTEVQIEKIRKLQISDGSIKWRKPDVSSTYSLNETKQKLVFEIQLSTTFLSVIVARNEFYKKDNTYIIWIFSDEYDALDKMTGKDIGTLNNKNYFILDDKAIEMSKKSGELTLKCVFDNYRKIINYENKYEIDKFSDNKYITIRDLSFNEKYEAYYFDSNERLNTIKSEVNELNIELTSKQEKEKQDKLLIETQEVRDLLNKCYTKHCLPYNLISKVSKLDSTCKEYIAKILVNKKNSKNVLFLEEICLEPQHLNFQLFLLDNHLNSYTIITKIRNITLKSYKLKINELKFDSSNDKDLVITILDSIMSIKLNDCVGWEYKNIYGIFNIVFEYERYNGVRYFMELALKKYNRLSEIYKREALYKKYIKYKNHKNKLILKKYNDIIFSFFPELE